MLRPWGEPRTEASSPLLAMRSLDAKDAAALSMLLTVILAARTMRCQPETEGIRGGAQSPGHSLC